jgi:hypothetical protein
MKKTGLFLVAIAAMALLFSGSALAQGDNSYYFVTYYSNNVSGAPDATLRFINDGSGNLVLDPTPQPIPINLWADIYVFDDSQELQACGSCFVSPDGLLSEDVKTELTNNTITGHVPSRGVIKVVTSANGNPTTIGLSSGLRGWATHIQRASATSGAYATTETQLADSNLTSTEEDLLENLCAYAQVLGSGQGTITCTQEDNDF